MDTISLRFDDKKFSIDDKARFVPEFSKRDFSDLSQKERNMAQDKKLRYIRKFTLHESRMDNLYIPQVEVYEMADLSGYGTVKYEMTIRFSVTKLLFKNSVQEISVSDYKQICHTLSERLRVVGIDVSLWSIEYAPVSVVHFCKNIFLPATLFLRTIISQLSRVDVGKAYQTTEETRRKDQNNAEILHLRCGTREWIFYDKTQETLQGKDSEKEIVNTYGLQDAEIFRIEYRLNKAQTIKSELNKILGRPHDKVVVFADLFTEDLWKKVLINSWQRISDRPENLIAMIGMDDERELYNHILKTAYKKDKSGHSQNKALWTCGLVFLIKKFGAKTVRSDMRKRWSGKSDKRFKEKLGTAASLIEDIPFFDGIAYICRELEKFETITPDFLDARREVNRQLQCKE